MTPASITTTYPTHDRIHSFCVENGQGNPPFLPQFGGRENYADAVTAPNALTWYAGLAPFAEFDELTDPAHYHALPDGWHLIVTDVVGSTRAIAAGRYKDVNTIGAACIVAVQNALGGADYPYAFGGDGATMAVPASLAPAATRALLAIQRLAHENFDLPLRVGSVPVAELRHRGAAVEIARHQLASGRSIAMFRGGGTAIAEKLVKAPGSPWQMSSVPGGDRDGDLSGLSCRWNAVPADHGCIATLLVVAEGDNSAAAYTAALALIRRITGPADSESVPIHARTMTYRSVATLLRDEWRFERQRLSLRFIWRLIELVLAVLIFRWGIPPLFFSSRHYSASLATHSDYRKFDDTLRMVLDVSPAQAEELRAGLEVLRNELGITYGLHISGTALMTCFVHGLGDGEHIHFVDGGDGGYAAAAAQLKAQRARAPA